MHAMSISWPFWCKFSFPQVLGFVALDWLWIYQIVKFKRLKYSPLNEEYRAHLTFILALRKGWEKWTKPTWLFFLRHPVEKVRAKKFQLFLNIKWQNYLEMTFSNGPLILSEAWLPWVPLKCHHKGLEIDSIFNVYHSQVCYMMMVTLHCSMFNNFRCINKSSTETQWAEEISSPQGRM